MKRVFVLDTWVDDYLPVSVHASVRVDGWVGRGCWDAAALMGWNDFIPPFSLSFSASCPPAPNRCCCCCLLAPNMSASGRL